MVGLRDAEEFQAQQLVNLSLRSYAELSQLPHRTRLPTPQSLHGIRLYICRRYGDNGGVAITVEAHKRFMFIFSGVSAPGFEKLSDETVLPLYKDKYDD